MLRSVDKVAVELGVSKTAIYNKLKLKEYEKLIVKKQGKSMVDDELFNLIKDNLRFKTIVENEESDNNSNEEGAMDSTDSINFNKELIDSLLEQLREKDKQIGELHKLIENSQVLLKEEQSNKKSQLLLEEHFQEVDQKLHDIKEKMELKKEAKKGIFNFFK